MASSQILYALILIKFNCKRLGFEDSQVGDRRILTSCDPSVGPCFWHNYANDLRVDPAEDRSRLTPFVCRGVERFCTQLRMKKMITCYPKTVGNT